LPLECVVWSKITAEAELSSVGASAACSRRVQLGSQSVYLGHSARTWLGLGLGFRLRLGLVSFLCALKLLLVNRLGGAWDDARGRDGA
jgi:hypothetical protein